MRKRSSSGLLFLLALLFVLNPFAGADFASAEGALDPAPQIVPAVPNGKRVLFDNTHAQTSGAADWVIDGAFSDFGQAIAAEGYYVKELRKQTPVTYEDLSSYDVFVIPEANTPFKKSEQDAMLRYVQQGGSIFFISDHYNADRNKNRWDSSEVMNGYRRGAWEDPAKGMTAGERASSAMQGVESSDWLADHFGIRFRYNALGDIGANIVKSPGETFGITEGVTSVAMHAGSTLMITDPAKAKGLVYVPKNVPKWSFAVDQGVYFNGGIEEGPYAAIAKNGKGKAGFIGDSSPVEDSTPKYVREENGQAKKTYDGFKEANDAKLLINMVNWLAKKEDYTTFQGTGIPLDAVSPQLDMEIPTKSTEPQPEPWAAPAPGYLWYDSSTFAPGSYGSNEAPVKQAVYTFSHPEVLPNNKPFKLQIKATGLKAGETVSDLSFGIYNPTGGAQLAKIQNADGSWPAAYGYSAPFTLAANANGEAQAELTIQISPDFSGQANLRLRAAKTNIVTKSAAVAAVEETAPPVTPVEPPKEEQPVPETTAAYVFNHPEVLPNNKPFKIQVKATGLKAGETVSDLNFGVYNPNGGAQLAKVQNADGSWPAAYGYSAPFTLTAGANGEAQAEVTVQINPDFVGQANLRLRAAKTNLVTKSAAVAVVEDAAPPVTPVEPPKEEQPVESALAQVRKAKAGTAVVAEGIITTDPDLFQKHGFYIQDEGAGIYVSGKAKGFKVGDIVRVTGKIGEHRGELEITKVKKIEKTGKAKRPSPELAAKAEDANQGKLIAFKQAAIKKVGKKEGSLFLTVEVEGKETHILIDKKIKHKLKLEKGDILDAAGISSIDKGTYYLKVVDKEDLDITKKGKADKKQNGKKPHKYEYSHYKHYPIAG